ncbi:hypothetical protein FOMPIDRAFT_1024616 [Fomitopsis schrenkii]|uniref:Uncharacterized protein n=1 Tax=Fomitopsis schrenkii TaxID=2126942 RepID=S8E4W9_FOMSC|nr:hypothetical protein FOMPIDRAFT_1024616 [Fomitopsis schrenkii]
MRYSTFTPALLVAAAAAPALAYPLTIRADQDLSLFEREFLDTLAARGYYYDDSIYARAQSPLSRRSDSSVSSSGSDPHRHDRSNAPSPSAHSSSPDRGRRSGAPSPSTQHSASSHSSSGDSRRSRSGAPSPSTQGSAHGSSSPRHGSSTSPSAHSSGHSSPSSHSSSGRSSTHTRRRDLARRAIDELVARMLSEMEVDELD